MSAPSGPRGEGPDAAGGARRRNARGHERGAVRDASRRTAQAPSQRRRGSDPSREVAFDVLRQVHDGDAYANLVLPPALRQARLTGRDAGFATELTYGTLRLRGRYDAVLSRCVSRPLDQVDPPVLDLLRLGAHQILGMRVPPHAAVSETVGLARSRTGAGSAQFVNAVLRRVSDRTADEWWDLLAQDAPDDVTRAATLGSHPVWVTRALRDALVAGGRDAGELDELLAADNAAPRVTLVARPGLIDVPWLRDEAREALGETDGALVPGRFAATAATLPGADPSSIPAVRAGAAGVQDEGSQLVTLALAGVKVEGRDERWLDMCAGPGGKAALLTAIAGERGARVLSNEVAPHRARLVEGALAAVPADAVEDVVVGDGRRFGSEQPGSFDRILLDAPCTGLGALRRRPEARWRRVPADVSALAQLQRELLASALDAVRPGGVVGYVTCSPHLAETRAVVDDVLARRGDVQRLDAPAAVRAVSVGPIDLTDGDDVQLWPHVHGTDAMHLTLLRRRA